MTGEIVYINGGEVYKEHQNYSGPVGEDFDYEVVDESDYISGLVHNKTPLVKRYKASVGMNEWLLKEEKGSTLSGYDLCPAVNLWWGAGFYDGNDLDFDLYFAVEDSTQLQQISDYYGMSYPIDANTTDLLDNDYDAISMYQNGETSIVIGSVKYQDGSPLFMKLYCVFKDSGFLTALQKEKVFSNGNVIEQGAQYKKLSENLYTYTSTSEGFETEFVENKTDPITQWEARRTNLATNETKIEHYESSRALRLGVGNLNTGSNYEEYDRAPSVNTWLGRSWIENEQEELYFLVEDREMLDEVANYYSLPVPYNDDLKTVLDTDLQSIRFKSYDLNNEGEGNFVAVVVAGIVFVDGQSTMLKLYETTRWNE